MTSPNSNRPIVVSLTEHNKKKMRVTMTQRKIPSSFILSKHYDDEKIDNSLEDNKWNVPVRRL